MWVVPNCLMPNCPLGGNMAEGNLQGNHVRKGSYGVRKVSYNVLKARWCQEGVRFCFKGWSQESVRCRQKGLRWWKEESYGVRKVSDGDMKMSDGLRWCQEGTRKLLDYVMKMSEGVRNESDGVSFLSGWCMMVSKRSQMLSRRC